MPPSEEGPIGRSRNISCLTFIIVLVLVAGALYFFRDAWLPKVNQMLGRGTAAQVPVDADDEEKITVYVLPEGYVYHRAGCSLLKGEIRAINLKQARVGGYRPCTKCNPPR